MNSRRTVREHDPVSQGSYTKVHFLLTLNISEREFRLISVRSRESHPIEACGILIGTVAGDIRTVEEARAARNQLYSESAYEIDPENLFHAFVYAEQNGLEVLGFYHSHPFWSAEASETDRTRANYPGFSYLIYSIPKNAVKSFYFNGKQLVPEPVRIIDEDRQSH